MQSSLIGKIEKAKRYALEPNRVTFSALSVKFHGEHDDYDTGFKDGTWHCSCPFFSTWGLCSHTLALESMLSDMLPPKAETRPDDISLLFQ
ncbi:SWIM zinc finger family protein [Chloroflexota bacterium]